MPFAKDRRRLVPNSVHVENGAKKNGLRHAIFTVSQNKYVGDWKEDFKDGKGRYLDSTGKQYEGDWKLSFRHGFGVQSIKKPNNVFRLQYRGEWEWGKMNGFGAFHYEDGSFYLGWWKNSKRQGYGQMWYANGGFYDGTWLKDKRHGEGLFVRPDGNRYEGTWAKDLKHGRGKFFHLDSGQVQEGVWQEEFCVYSQLSDIPFRQTAQNPTQYAIKRNELKELYKICAVQEAKALEGRPESCLTLSSSLPSSLYADCVSCRGDFGKENKYRCCAPVY